MESNRPENAEKSALRAARPSLTLFSVTFWAIIKS